MPTEPCLGEGAGVVVLRPLEEALRRGDRIYGVIKGTGVSTGNGTVGFTAPNPQAQAEAIRRALASARIDPRTVSYIETHGTGTGLGDPIEVRGLTLGYDRPELHDPALALRSRCRIGSIKPNIGHLEAGAGIIGLIKVLLQLQHGMLLPSITSARAEPGDCLCGRHIRCPAGTRALATADDPVEWHRVTVPRRAGLSSFGVGGANAHVIVEEAAGSRLFRPGNSDADRTVQRMCSRCRRAARCAARQAATMREFVRNHDHAARST